MVQYGMGRTTTLRVTATNPTGAPMKRSTWMIPEETLFRMAEIQRRTGKPIPVQVREALDRFITLELMSGEASRVPAGN